MKILSVRFQNLNSLKGEHFIEFDKPPFTESGLFSITGPTGAGKTTILDAITIALYGKVHRHEKEPEESMTRFTAESFSEVVFEVNQKVYRTKWSQRRARGRVDGKLQGVTMELSDAETNKILLTTPPTAVVTNKVIELCGLDYKQFLRSVMLSQGDFTRFLRSSVNERSELLEKITDSGIYSEISTFVYKKTSAEEQKLKDLKSQMNNVQLLSEEAITTIENQVVELSNQEKDFISNKQKAERHVAWLNGINNLSSKHKNHEEELQQLNKEAEERRTDFEKLALHHKAVVHKPALAEIELLVKREAGLHKDVEQMEQSIPALQKELEFLKTQHTEAEESYSSAKRNQEEAMPVIDQVVAKDAELKNLKLQLQHSQQRLTDTTAELEKAVKVFHEKKEGLNKAGAEDATLKEWISLHQHDEGLDKKIPVFAQHKKQLAGLKLSKADVSRKIGSNSEAEKTFAKLSEQLNCKRSALQDGIASATTSRDQLKASFESHTEQQSLDSLEAEANELPEQIILLKDLDRCANQYKKFTAQQLSGEEELKVQSEKIIIHTEELEQLTVNKQQADRTLDNLRRLVELEIKVKNYEADREALQQDEACPLCGSTEHPLKEKYNSGQLSEAKRCRDEQEKLVNGLAKEIEQKNILLTTVQTKCARIESDILQFKTSIAEQETFFNDNNKLLSDEYHITQPELFNHVISDKQRYYEEVKRRIEQLKKLQKQITDLDVAINTNKQKQFKLEAEIAANGEAIKNAVVEKSRLQEEEKKILLEEEKTISTIQELLASNKIVVDVENPDTTEAEMTKRSKQFLTSVKRAQELETIIAKLDTEAGHAKEKVDELRETERQLKLQVNSEQVIVDEKDADRKLLFGEKDPAAERKMLTELSDKTKRLVDETLKKFNEHQQKLKVDESKLEEWRNDIKKTVEERASVVAALLLKLAAEQIPSVEALNQCILEDVEAKKIDEFIRSIEERKQRIGGVLKTVKEEYELEVNKNLTTDSIEKLAAEAMENEEKIKELNQKVGEHKTILAKNAEAIRSHHGIAAQVEVQEKEFARWNKLCALIGSNDGNKFSRFAQGLTLARLTELANRHLRKLSDRYIILKSPKEDLELQIIDSYQADVVRPMTTLSGGESFLVSLALALGLSDLAGKKVQIKSLFIDEGFGTLDADTLDIAITALENLQASGKMIGIISHVEALKDKISTQIVVSKQAGGYSKVTVMSGGVEVGVGVRDIEKI